MRKKKQHKRLPTKNEKENVCHCESRKTTETVLVFGSLPMNQKGLVKMHSLCRAPSLLKKTPLFTETRFYSHIA